MNAKNAHYRSYFLKKFLMHIEAFIWSNTVKTPILWNVIANNVSEYILKCNLL